MFSLRRPPADVIADVLRRAEGAPWSYDAVGATRGELPAAITRTHFIDRNETVLGLGRAVFERASAALLAWRGFEIPWLELAGRQQPVATGRAVATLVHTLGLWAMNPCRVVYTIGGDDDPDRVGFAYGTVDGHVERGEERFLVEHDRRSDRVRYEILAFSRPNHVLAKLGVLYVRRLQRRFGKSALEAMRRAVG